MSYTIELYDFRKQLEVSLGKLDSPDILERNKEIILTYHKQLIAEGVGISRRLKTMHVLRRYAKRIEKPFDKLNKDDVVDLMGYVETHNWSSWTKYDYKIMFKKFFKWLKDINDAFEKWGDELADIRPIIPVRFRRDFDDPQPLFRILTH